MSDAFVPGAARRAGRDVRLGAGIETPSWARRLFERPNGAAWLVVGNRRQGKTWLVEGLAEVAELDDTAYVACDSMPSTEHLRQRWTSADKPNLVLVDEPHRLVQDASALHDWCGEVRARGGVVVLTLTPREWVALTSNELWGQAFKDTMSLPHLTEAETRRMADRVEWGHAALAAVTAADAAWARNPLTLEMALRAWGQHRGDEGGSPGDLPAVLAESARNLASQPDMQVGPQVLGNGLDARQRRKVVHRWFAEVSTAHAAAGVDNECDATAAPAKLRPPNALGAVTDLVTDPIIGCSVLRPPLRIHHLSDLHLGGDLPLTVVPGPPGTEAAAGLAGAGTLADAYLRHLTALAEPDRPDLVVISGDLVDRTGPAGADAVRKFLGTLHSLINQRRLSTHIIVVPGNHDVQWPETVGEPLADRHRWMCNLLDELSATVSLAHPGLDGRSGAPGSVSIGDESLRVWMLPSASADGELVPPGETSLANRLIPKVVNDGFSTDAVNVLERLNPAVVPADLLVRMSSEPAEDDWVHLAVTHHPVVPVPNIDLRAFASLVNAGTVLSHCAVGRVSAVLSGHVHQGGVSRVSLGDVPWTVRACSAPSLTGVHGSAAGFNAMNILRVGDAPPLIDLRRLAIAADGSVAADGHPEVFRPGSPQRLTLSDTLDHLCAQWHPYDTVPCDNLSEFPDA